MTSLKNIENTLKDLGQKNDIESLQAFVSKLEDEKVCTLVSSKICYSDITQVLNYLYKGMPKHDGTEMKRFKLTEKVLKELQTRKLPSMQVNAIISRIALEVEKLTPSHLVQFCEYCINCIQQDSEQTCWKDLLPKLLNTVVACDEVNHAGIDMNGADYKMEVVKTLLMVQWQPSIATSLASMFTEIPLATDQHLQIVNKLCASLNEMDPPEVPPLVHQLLQLCKNEHSVELFLGLDAYFSKRLYSGLDADDDINAASDCEAQFAEATVLFHIHQAARFGHASVKNFIKYMKSMCHAPELVLDPFLLTVLLSLSTISIYEESVYDLLKNTLQCHVHEEEFLETSAWLRGVTPTPGNLQHVFSLMMENSLKERSTVIEGLVNLSFVLLAVSAVKGKESATRKLWDLGTFLLVRLIKRHRETASTVLQLLTNNIIISQSDSQYTKCLHQMAVSVPLVLNDNRPIIVNLLEVLTQLPGPVAEDVVHALLPTVRAFPSLRDVLIMVLRKALFSRNVATRKMAVTGFLELLKNLEVKVLAILSSQSSSQISGNNSNSLLTQIDMECVGSNNNEAICLEVLGVLRRCFMQQAVVRLCLYKGLHSGVIKNPELSVFVSDMLVSHFSQYYESDTSTLPPVKFSAAVVGSELKEPLGHLMFAMQQVVTATSTSSRLTDILDSVSERIVKCSLENFGLNETVNLGEDKSQQEAVRQVLGVHEALMGYIVSSWARESSGAKSQQLINMFKSYYRVVEFVKNSGKPGKKADDETRPKRADGEKKGKARGGAFKFPDPVLDYPVTCKMVALLHVNSLSWCTSEAANLVKGRRELNRFVMETLLKLLKSSRAKSSKPVRQSLLISIGDMLYRHCVSRLQEFQEFDISTALLSLESFNELLALFCTSHRDKLGQLLEQLVEVPAADGLSKQLLVLASKYEELLTHVLTENEDAEEEPAAKKIPPLLVQGLTFLAQQIPGHDTCSELLQWLKNLLRDTELSHTGLVRGLVALLFSLETRCKMSSQLYKQFAMQLCQLMGTVEDGEEVEKFTPYSVLRTGGELFVLSALSDSVKKHMEHIDWMLLRLRSEHSAVLHCSAGKLQAKREFLKSKEQDIVCETSNCVQVLNYMSSLSLEPGHRSDVVLKLLAHQYTTLTILTKHFILRCSKTALPFQTARFETVVKLAGKILSPHVYNLISHIEASQKRKKKDKKSDPLTLKTKILRETHYIPQLIFQMEQFEKFIIMLSRKTKVNLMSCVKMSTYRDFRIQSKVMQAALNTDEIEEDTLSTSKDTSNVSEEPPKKKPRKE